MARKRKSGTGTIRQRKDGRWEGRAVVPSGSLSALPPKKSS